VGEKEHEDRETAEMRGMSDVKILAWTRNNSSFLIYHVQDGSSLGLNLDISKNYKMGEICKISKGVANTL
jgi:hypothetical protein